MRGTNPSESNTEPIFGRVNPSSVPSDAAVILPERVPRRSRKERNRTYSVSRESETLMLEVAVLSKLRISLTFHVLL